MNPTTGLFQTLVAAASAAADSLKFRNAFVDAIYWDFKPIVASPNTSLSVIIPTVDEADVVDIGSGPLNPTDTDHNSVSIPYDKHFSTSFVIKAFDQARTPQQLQKTYLQPRLEALLRKVNSTISLIANTTAFGTGATPVAGFAKVSGGTAGYFTRTDIAACWNNLVKEGVPVDERENMFFLTSPTAYSKMLTDQTMSYSYIDKEASEAQRYAKLALQIGAEVRYDQHYATNSVANGFTSAKEPGILLHRYAIAAVTAQPPPTDTSVSHIQEQIIWLKDVLPVQIQAGYSLKDQGTLVNIHCYWGVKAARADYGSTVEAA
jgi:P22 coat protein - gene protein 5